MRRLLLSCWLLLIPLGAFALPLQTAILSPSEEEVGTALIYIDYVELLDPSKRKMGKIAYAMQEGFANYKNHHHPLAVLCLVALWARLE